ncbi:MAG TPA: hypothetical protein VGM89_12865 [Puia sp.]|jgi:hypothetical protein
MKWLFCLFSLYILVLAGIPCRADDDCCIEETIANASRPQPDKQPQHPTYPSPCSPFFACGACHGFVIPDNALVVPKHQPAQPPQQTFYQAIALPNFTRVIWQPPKSA